MSRTMRTHIVNQTAWSTLLLPLCSTLALVLAHTVPVSAQQQTVPLPAVDDLKAPPSPAFVLLGVAPSKVERPQAVRPLVLSALSAISSEGFPRNYAVEFAPYWLGTPSLSFDDYYNSSVAEAIPRHLSISVATTPLDTTEHEGTALAIGVRTLPLPGRPHPKLTALRGKLRDLQQQDISESGFFGRRQRLITLLQEAQQTTMSSTTQELATPPFEDLIDRMIDLDLEIERLEANLVFLANELQELAKLPVDRRAVPEAALKEEQTETNAALQETRAKRKQLGPEIAKTVTHTAIANNLAVEKQFELLIARYDQAQKAALAKVAADLRSTALAIQALDTQRVGPLLAVAAAVAWDVPSNQTELATLSKVGVWVTSGYRIVRCVTEQGQQTCSSAVDILGVVRYLDNRRSLDTGRSWELGGRVVWQARTKLALSGEWLGRTGDAESGSRLVGVAEYEINDSAFLYASFGRDFEEAGVRRNLVSTVGVTFGFGQKPILN